MAEIFISYAREDRETVARLAGVLDDHGWSVWWDRQIPIGRRFDVFIAEKLSAAHCVIVLWSYAAVASHWVSEEAAEGRNRDILVPARLDDVPLPLGFRGLQTADLTTWRGEAEHSELRRLIRDIEALIGVPLAAPPVALVAAAEHDEAEADDVAGTASPKLPPQMYAGLADFPVAGLGAPRAAATDTTSASASETFDQIPAPALPQTVRKSRLSRIGLRRAAIAVAVLVPIAAGLALVDWRALQTSPPMTASTSLARPPPTDDPSRATAERREEPAPPQRPPEVAKRDETVSDKPDLETAAPALPILPHPASPPPIPPSPFPKPLAGERVIDAAGVLTEADRSDLTALIKSRRTAFDPLFVVTVASLAGLDGDEFADRLIAAWQADPVLRKPGLLLLVAPGDGQASIRVDPKNQKGLDEAARRRIVETQLVPNLRSKGAAAAIGVGMDAILQAVGGPAAPNAQPTKPVATATPAGPRQGSRTAAIQSQPGRGNQAISQRCQQILTRAQVGDVSPAELEECKR